MVIVGKFSVRDFVCPGTRVGSTEDSKICFNLLVDMFCFTIRLGVIGGGEGEIVVEEFAKFFDEDGCKLRATIRDDFVIKSES